MYYYQLAMPIQRTVRDIHALCLLQNEEGNGFKAGEEVEISRRADRLEEYGWIEENDGTYTLTETGAAIVTYFMRLKREGTLLDELENGAGHFVDKAIDEEMHEHTFGKPSVVDVNENEITMERECTVCGEPERETYPRTEA